MARLIVIWGLVLGMVAAPDFACAAAPAPLVLVAPMSGAVRALVVGIDHYRNVNPLRGAVADARDIETALTKMGSTDVTALIDAEADRASVLRELDRLVARTHSGDLVIITLAGHGSKEDERVKGSSSDAADEVFLLVGFDPKTGPGGAEKVLNHEFHHYIKLLEDLGAQVIFVADTCYGGGLAREIAVGSPDITYRQVPRYRLVEDDLKPVSTPADAFLTDLDFQRTTFLAAVDSETKAPEVLIDNAYRGALSYAFARAVEGAADEKHDGKITMRELFAYARKVVYQLSDERQNIVTMDSPNRDLDREVVFQFGSRGIAQPAPTAAPIELPALAQARPVRLASITGRSATFANLRPLNTPYEIVDPDASPDLTWDPVNHEAIAGGDKVALDVEIEDLPGVIDRTAAVRDLKSLVVKAPQALRVWPDASLHRKGSKVEVELTEIVGRNFIMVDITGSGTVQLLYSSSGKTRALGMADYRIPFLVRDPFGADQVLVVTSASPMDSLLTALRELDRRRSAGRIFDVIRRFGPPDARLGLVGLFTVP